MFTISRRRATTFRKCSPSPVRDTVIDSTATPVYLIRMYRLASHLRNPFLNLRSSGVFGLFYQVHFGNYVLPCVLNFSTFTSENLNFCGRELHYRVYSLTALEGLPDRIYFAYSSLSLSLVLVLTCPLLFLRTTSPRCSTTLFKFSRKNLFPLPARFPSTIALSRRVIFQELEILKRYTS